MLDMLKEKIDNNHIFTHSYVKEHSVDTLLDMRDNKEFESEWMRVYNDLSEVEVDEHDYNEIDTICQKCFLKIYNLYASSEMAGCVSDDFEIICKAYLSGYDDIWLNSLIMAYIKGKFPCGNIEKTNNNIKTCIDILLNQGN